MKFTFIVGSGHGQSRCLEIAKNEVQYLKEKGYEDIHLINLVDYDIHECLGCEFCLAHQDSCVIPDQMQEIYKLFKETDVLIFVSPVYFSNIPATLKKVIDRCQLFYNLKDKSSVTPKKFIGIHIGGAPNYPDQFEAYKLTYKVLLPDFKADLIGLITFDNSDRNDPLENKEKLQEIRQTINASLN